MQRKVQQYLAAGAQAVWVWYPRKHQAVVHGRSAEPVTLLKQDYLEAPELLPGLRILVAEIFKPE